MRKMRMLIYMDGSQHSLTNTPENTYHYISGRHEGGYTNQRTNTQHGTPFPGTPSLPTALTYIHIDVTFLES